MFAVAIRGLALPTCRTGRAIVQRADCTGNIVKNASRAAVGSCLSGMGWARTESPHAALSHRAVGLAADRTPAWRRSRTQPRRTALVQPESLETQYITTSIIQQCEDLTLRTRMERTASLASRAGLSLDAEGERYFPRSNHDCSGIGVKRKTNGPSVGRRPGRCSFFEETGSAVRQTARAFWDRRRRHAPPSPASAVPTSKRVVGSGTTPATVTSTGPVRP